MAFAAGTEILLSLLQRVAHTSGIAQGHSPTPRSPTIRSCRHRPSPVRIAPSLRADMISGGTGGTGAGRLKNPRNSGSFPLRKYRLARKQVLSMGHVVA